jgi:hypothetical protein
MTWRRPSPFELANDPERAALAALDLLLEISVSALLAEHPDLGAEPEPHHLTALAAAIIEAAHALHALLRRYRAALARHQRDVPF